MNALTRRQPPPPPNINQSSTAPALDYSWSLKRYSCLCLKQIGKGKIPLFLGCPDVDPMHSPKIGYSLCSQYLVSKLSCQLAES